MFSAYRVKLLAAGLLWVSVTFITNYVINLVTSLARLDSGESILETFSLINMLRFRILSYPFVYLPFALMKAVLTAGYLRRVDVSLTDYNTGQKGHAREATDEELDRQYDEVPLCHEEYEGRHGYIVRMRPDPADIYAGTALIDREIMNRLIASMSQSGKSNCIIFPDIDMFSRVREVQNGIGKHKPSMVITDPKRELFCSCREILENRGYRVILIDLMEPARSDHYNPLSHITDLYRKGMEDEGENQINLLVNDLYSKEEGKEDNPFFRVMAMQFATAAIIAHTKDCIEVGRPEANTLSSVARNLASMSLIYHDPDTFQKQASDELKKKTSYLDAYFLLRDPSSRERILASTILTQPEETKQNIRATTMKNLMIFTTPVISEMLSEDEISGRLLGFGEQPMAVFISSPETNMAYESVFTTFFTQISFQLSLEATLNGGKLERPVEFIFDEFGNIPRIPRLENIMTICLGKNIRYTFVIQSYSQLEDIYGTKVANIIIENCATEYFLLSKDLETRKHFSELLGEITVTDISRSGKELSLEKNFTESLSAKDLISPYELRELKQGECIIVRSINRKDRYGSDITPYPIVNRGEKRMLMRWQYALLEDMPERSIDDVRPRRASSAREDHFYDMSSLVRARIYHRKTPSDDKAVLKSTERFKSAADEARTLTDELDKRVARLKAENLMRDKSITPEMLKELRDIGGDDTEELIIRTFKLRKSDKEALSALMSLIDTIIEESEELKDD